MKTITAKTPRDAASATFKALKSMADKYGMDTSDLFLWDPERADLAGFGKVWSICWESGPYEWGIRLSMGEAVLGTFGEGKPEINLMNNPDWYCECYWSFTLLFTPS